MMDGFLNLLKPPGMTSSDAVAMVRRMLPRGTRVGHGGTLDPDASGVLPIMVGRAARLFDYIVDKRKCYVAELCLGIETDTQDATGQVIARSDGPVASGQKVRDALPLFEGRILQTPPGYSAIKKNGKRLYELAREGREICADPRPVMVYELRYLRQSGVGRHLIWVACGKGLYVRALASDIGRVLGCGAHMSFLLRTQAGSFELESARTPEELLRGDLAAHLLAMDAALSHLPRADVGAEYERAIRNGNPVPLLCPTHLGERDGPFRIYCGDRFCGIGEARIGGLVRFRAMLLGEERGGNGA